MKTCLNLAISLSIALFTGMACADVWDLGDNDNGPTTDNELIHGSLQVHDLGAQVGPVADEDWFLLTIPPYSSMEVVIDGTTGDLNDTFDDTQLEILSSANPYPLLVGHVCFTDRCFSKRVARLNAGGGPAQHFVRVRGQSCATACTTSDQYTIRARDTTISIARFNNTGSQVTVLLTQNTSDVPINATLFFWGPAGNLLTSSAFVALAPKALSVASLASNDALAGQSGSITIAHNGPFGGLNVKAVALEPATGFSFDTPGVTRPY